MKPSEKAKLILKYTRSIAKMIEFGVSDDERKRVESHMGDKPEDLFCGVIFAMSDLTSEYMAEEPNVEILQNQEEKLKLCALFFENYKNTNRLNELDSYCLLVGASAYYLCNRPGSCSVLIKNMEMPIDLNVQFLDFLLVNILKNSFVKGLENEGLYKDYIYQLNDSLCDFFNEGIISDIKTLLNDFREYVYKNGSPKELFFIDIICAVILKKIENSCWMKLPEYSDLSVSEWKTTLKKESFIKELWPAQDLLGREDVYKGKSAVIQMPTSAGKTKSTELIIRSAFLSNRTNCAVIVAPFKALCHEIRMDYRKAFVHENVRIDEISDVLENTSFDFLNETEHKNIVVLTPEKLFYILKQQHDLADKFGLIIFDEAHQFDSGERGVTYELLITELNGLLSPECPKILISAVIHNAKQVSEWIFNTNNVVSKNDIQPTQRSIGFVKFVGETGSIEFYEYDNPNVNIGYVPKTIPIIKLNKKGRERKEHLFPEKNDSQSIALFLGIKMSQFAECSIFCGLKSSVSKILRDYVSDLYKRNPDYSKPSDFSDEMEKTSLQRLIFENFGDDSYLYCAAKYGIFAHHADIPEGIRHAIEFALRKEKIKLVVCTSTLAQGVNLPIKYMLISTTQQGKERIKIRDFHNLIGRVGRAGKLTEGSFIFTNPDILGDFEKRANINELLDPSLSENCGSSLILLFKPFLRKYSFSITYLLELYFLPTIDEELRLFKIEHPEDDVGELRKELECCFLLIEKIENYLIAIDESTENEKIKEIAKSTFAYKLATERQKGDIETLFVSLYGRIKDAHISQEERIVFSKTMRGLQSSMELKSYVARMDESLKNSETKEEILEILWPCMQNQGINKFFNQYPNKALLKESIKSWLNGNSFGYLYNILKKEKIGNRELTIDNCVDIFENGLGYSGTLFVNAVAELYGLMFPHYAEIVKNKLLLFQKQLKYGLPNIESIMLYEVGFCDRMISRKIARLLPSCDNKDRIMYLLIMNADGIREILNQYPSYYRDVLKKIVL